MDGPTPSTVASAPQQLAWQVQPELRVIGRFDEQGQLFVMLPGASCVWAKVFIEEGEPTFRPLMRAQEPSLHYWRSPVGKVLMTMMLTSAVKCKNHK